MKKIIFVIFLLFSASCLFAGSIYVPVKGYLLTPTYADRGNAIKPYNVSVGTVTAYQIPYFDDIRYLKIEHAQTVYNLRYATSSAISTANFYEILSTRPFELINPTSSYYIFFVTSTLGGYTGAAYSNTVNIILQVQE